MGEKLDKGRGSWKIKPDFGGGVKQKNPKGIFDQHVNAKHLAAVRLFL